MTQVVALVNEESGQAAFAASLTSVFGRAGHDLQLRSHRDLVAETTIVQALGQRPLVEPDRPLLWLTAADLGRDQSADGRFLAAETGAAARSIAMLTRSPVLNRPSAVSATGLLPPGPALGVRRARRMPLPDGTVRTENFISTMDVGPDDLNGSADSLVEIYDYSTAIATYRPHPSAAGPFRYRAAVPSAELVKIRVVGNQAIVTAPAPTGTIDASTRIASWFELDLATLWWLIKSNTETVLARIDCSSWDVGFDGNMDEVASATLAWLNERLAQRVGVGAGR